MFAQRLGFFELRVSKVKRTVVVAFKDKLRKPIYENRPTYLSDVYRVFEKRGDFILFFSRSDTDD